jgi:DNA-binding transcriptional MerR regulator
MNKSPDAFRTISEVATDLDLPQHVLRFWEPRFSQIKPMKRTGGRRYYRPEDIELVRAIKSLLYGQGYTIKGVQKLFKENGVRAVVAAASGGAPLGPVQAALAQEREEASSQGRLAPEAAPVVRAVVAYDRLAAIAEELEECARILQAARAS